MLFLPEGHKDGVPFLMHNNLLRHDGLGAGLVLQQVVFAHKHPVGEVGAGGERADVGGPRDKQTRQKIQRSVERFDEFKVSD